MHRQGKGAYIVCLQVLITRDQSPVPGFSLSISTLPGLPSHSAASAGASPLRVIFGQISANLRLTSSQFIKLGFRIRDNGFSRTFRVPRHRQSMPFIGGGITRKFFTLRKNQFDGDKTFRPQALNTLHLEGQFSPPPPIRAKGGNLPVPGLAEAR